MIRLVVVGCLALGVLSACAEDPCTLSSQAATLASDRQDCGRAGIGEDTTAVHACAATAFEAGLAFDARYEVQGIDSQVVHAIIGDADGHVWELHYDSGCCGEDALASVWQGECEAPVVATATIDDPQPFYPAPGGAYIRCAGLSTERVCRDSPAAPWR